MIRLENISVKVILQRMGAAMFMPMFSFTFSFLLLGLILFLKSPTLFAYFSNSSSFGYKFLTVIEEGGWTIFRNLGLIFCLSIPISLAKVATERAMLATLVSFLCFHYFIAIMLKYFGSSFGVNYSDVINTATNQTGLSMVLGIKTLDMGIMGGIIVGFLVSKIHNRFYTATLPDYLGVFQGSSLVHIISFFVMLPLAFLSCLVWPWVQRGIDSLQLLLIQSDFIGVWIYTFLERILIPTGLHHFIYGPFVWGSAVVDGGIQTYWINHLQEFANQSEPLKTIFPEGGFALCGNSKIFGLPGIALAIYSCTDKQKRKITATLLIPITITAAVIGITEPLEFTFLMSMPFLFLIHSLLAATMATTMYLFGVVGNMNEGLAMVIANNWIFTAQNHLDMVITQIAIGLIFMLIYFLLFRYLIIKYHIPLLGK